MGTRSLTIVRDEDDREILTLYRQFDGYPEGGHGEELARFLNGFEVVNGITSYDVKKLANGAGCLAAQIVAKFKRPTKSYDGKRQGPVGNFYIYPAGSRNVGEEYIYTVRAVPGQPLTVEVFETYGDEGTILKPSTPKAMLAWIRKRKRAEAAAG